MAKVSELNFHIVQRAVGVSATKVLHDLLQERVSNARLRNRLTNATTQETLIAEIKLYAALGKQEEVSESPHKIWTVGKSNFQFFELLEFTNGLTWDKHEGSIPNKLLGVRWQESNGQEWQTLPINVGFSSKKSPTRRTGHGAYLEKNPFLTTKGALPKVAVISGYVEDHYDPIMRNGLKKRDIRGRVENALMQLLFATGTDMVQSCILTNIRNNPVKGVMLAITGLYKTFPHTILPFKNTVNMALRSRIRLNPAELLGLIGYKYSRRHSAKKLRELDAKIAATKLNVAKDQQNNGACWIAYFNPVTMDVKNLPKLNLEHAFASNEIRKEFPYQSQIKDYFSRLEAILDVAYGTYGISHATRQGYTQFVPKNLLTERNLTEHSKYVHEVIQTNNPRPGLPHEPKLVKLEGRMWTPLHHIAKNRELTHIPIGMLTQRNLTVRAKDGTTPIHWVAKNGDWDKLPVSSINKRTLTVTNQEGWTPVHEAASCGMLTQFPNNTLTNQMFTAKDVFGWTPIHVAVANGHVKQIPKDILIKSINVETNDGYSSLDLAKLNYTLSDLKEVVGDEFDGLAINNDQKLVCTYMEILQAGYCGSEDILEAEEEKRFGGIYDSLQNCTAIVNAEIRDFMLALFAEGTHTKFLTKYIITENLHTDIKQCEIIKYIIRNGGSNVEDLRKRFPEEDICLNKIEVICKHVEKTDTWIKIKGIDEDYYVNELLDNYTPNLESPSRADDLYFSFTYWAKSIQEKQLKLCTQLLTEGKFINDNNWNNCIEFLENIIQRQPNLLSQELKSKKLKVPKLTILPAIFAAVVKGKQLQIILKDQTKLVVAPSKIVYEDNHWQITTPEAYRLDSISNATLID